MNKSQDIKTKIFTFPLDDMINSIIDSVTFCRGGRSSVGRALGCDPSRRGFESRRSPHFPHHNNCSEETLFDNNCRAIAPAPFAPGSIVHSHIINTQKVQC